MKNLNYMAASRPLVGFAGSLHPAVDRRSGRAERPEATYRQLLDSAR